MGSRVYEQERFILQVQELIAAAIEKKQITRTTVAKALGKNRSFVTQALSGGRNLTLKSAADLAHACGYRLVPFLERLP